MTSSLETGGEEDLGKLTSETGSESSCSHAHDVGIVVQASEPCGEGVGAQSGSDTLDLVGGNGHSDTRTADEDTLFALAGGDLPADLLSDHRIIAGFAVSAHILELESLIRESLDDRIFHFNTCMVAADSYC